MYARLTMRSLAGDEVSAMNSIWMMPDNGRAVSELLYIVNFSANLAHFQRFLPAIFSSNTVYTDLTVCICVLASVLLW